MGRVIGGETEWLLPVTNKNSPGVGYSNFFGSSSRRKDFMEKCLPAKYLFSNMRYRTHSNKIFLRNGARFYFDNTDQLEYAAAEGDGPLAALIHERAGDIITEEAIAGANRLWAEEGYRFRSYKSNLDAAGDCVGFHENYLMSRNLSCVPADHDPFEWLLLMLGPHLVSRIFYTGNGWVYIYRGAQRLTFSISQRAQVTEYAISQATTLSRGILHTRDEPHADRNKFRRLHIICGDSLIAEPAAYLRYAVTDLIIEMIESGFLTENACANFVGVGRCFVDAFRSFSSDPELTATASFGGKKLSAVNIQEWYRELAGKYIERRGNITAEERLTFFLWDKVIAAAKTPKPHEALAPYVDWAMKKMLVEKDMSRRGYDWKCPIAETPSIGDTEQIDESAMPVYMGALMLCKKFAENSPAGYGRKLIASGAMERVLGGNAAQRATILPLKGCRSYARALQLRWLQKAAASLGETFDLDVDWEFIHGKVEDDMTYHYIFNNPDPRDPNPKIPLDP